MHFDFSLINIENTMASLKVVPNQEQYFVHHEIDINQWKEKKMGNLSCHSVELSKYCRVPGYHAAVGYTHSLG